MNKTKSDSISSTGFLATLAALGVGAGCYAADVHNLPVLAPYLDLIAEKIYGYLPLLKAYPSASMLVSSSAVALVFFLVVTMLISVFSKPVSTNDKMELKLKSKAKQRRKNHPDENDRFVSQ